MAERLLLMLTVKQLFVLKSQNQQLLSRAPVNAYAKPDYMCGQMTNNTRGSNTVQLRGFVKSKVQSIFVFVYH